MKFESEYLDEYIAALCTIIERKMYKVCSIYITEEYINCDKLSMEGPVDIKFKVLMTQQEINDFSQNFSFLAPYFEKTGVQYYDFDLETLEKTVWEEKDYYEKWKLEKKIERVKENYALDSKPYLREYIDKISKEQDYLSALDEVVDKYTNYPQKTLK